MDRDVIYCRDENIFGKPGSIYNEGRKIYFSRGKFVTRKASCIIIGGGICAYRCANIYIVSSLKCRDILQRSADDSHC